MQLKMSQSVIKMSGINSWLGLNLDLHTTLSGLQGCHWWRNGHGKIQGHLTVCEYINQIREISFLPGKSWESLKTEICGNHGLDSAFLTRATWQNTGGG